MLIFKSTVSISFFLINCQNMPPGVNSNIVIVIFFVIDKNKYLLSLSQNLSHTNANIVKNLSHQFVIDLDHLSHTNTNIVINLSKKINFVIK